MRKITIILATLFLSASLSAQNRAYTPTLTAPADSTEQAMPVTLLDWEPIAGYHGIHYEIQVDDNTNFDSPVELTSVETAIYTPSLKFNTTYYWRVRAIDDDQSQPVSDWSDPWSYTTFNTVALNSPASNHTTAQTPRPFVKWKSTNSSYFNGIEKFEVAYSVNEDMSDATTKFYDFSNSNNTLVTVTDTLKNLLFGQIYYWNVRAYNNGEGEFESVSDWCEAPYTFIVVDEPELNKPQMKNGRNEDVDPNVSLELKNEYLAIGYEFEIAKDENFENSIGIYSSTSKNFNAPSLAFGERYYWRARHAYAGNTSTWSFTDNQVWWFEVINAPELKAPANNIDLGANGALTWSAIPTTTEYTIAVSKDSNFPNADTLTYIVQVAPTTSNIQSFNINKVSSLINTANVKYYWKIKATHVRYDGVTEDTEWSETRAFVYNPTGISDYGFSTSIYPNPSNGTFTIEVEENINNAIVTVYDLAGRVRYQNNLSFNGNRQELSLSLEKGMYIVEINNNGMKSIKKITIQ